MYGVKVKISEDLQVIVIGDDDLFVENTDKLKASEILLGNFEVFLFAILSRLILFGGLLDVEGDSSVLRAYLFQKSCLHIDYGLKSSSFLVNLQMRTLVGSK